MYTEKAFDKIQHPFMIKILKKLEIKGERPQDDKGHLPKNHTYLNIILNGDRLNTDCFPPKVRNKTRIFILTTSIQHCT